MARISRAIRFLFMDTTQLLDQITAKKKAGRHPSGCNCGRCVQSGGTGGYHGSRAKARTAKKNPAPPADDGVRPDSDLFGSLKSPPENSANENAAGIFPPDDGAEQPDDGAEQPDDGAAKPEDHRAIATMVWDSIVGFLAMMVGVFWFPRPFGKNVEKGEIPYDEREMVVSAFCVYFASIGLKVLSPFESLCMAIFGYSLPRLRETMTWFKFKFMKKAQPAKPANDSRMPGEPPKEPEKEKSTEPATAGNVSLDSLI
jgi:hypothetical protein